MTDNSKKVYFASDFHLGAPDYESSLIREKKIVSWLNHIENDAKEIFLVGDIFDFWFEYKRAIPRGFVRLQGKIAELTDKGIPIHIFTGNHGDGLGPGDKGYKFLKKVFANKFCQWCFARLHPNFGIWLADKSSKTSRAKTGTTDEKYHGDENEWLYLFCKETLEKKHYDTFIFGHRHLPIEKQVGNNSTYYNLGEWINYCTYLVVDENSTTLEKWEE